MNQLNHLFFPGNENKLRLALYERIRPLFPNQVISTAIDAELKTGFKLDEYDDAMHEGNLCEECKEPSCCTVAEVVALTDKDIDRLIEKGHKDFFHMVEREGRQFNSIKRCKPCQFLKNHRCTIYEYRPNVCWRYPMQINADTNKPLFLIAGDCCIAFNVMKQQIIDAIRKTDGLI
jgi:Fe-S-cluster containining protein